jgi:hypothetical protein
MEVLSAQSPIGLPVTSYHADKALYQEQIHKALTSFTYPGHVAARLETTAKSIAEILALTRTENASEKLF